MKRVCIEIERMKGHLISVRSIGAKLGEVAYISRADGNDCFATVIKIEKDIAVLQVLGSVSGICTSDKVSFLGRSLNFPFSVDILGRQFNGLGEPIDGGYDSVGHAINLDRPSFNPVVRKVPRRIVKTNIPAIDVYNCLVRSQKIPIFSSSGEPHNELLVRIANQTDADVVVCGGMGLVFDDYDYLINGIDKSKSVSFLHTAVDPLGECLLIPDICLSVAQEFAMSGKGVLVLLTDMTVFADALKEIAIGMDQIPSNRGYPGSLYSDLASRYEKAIELSDGGSITIISVTTMPGGDITHPVPDNTGYITEGQFVLKNGRIDLFSSLSRLKQLVIGKQTREDHAELANNTVRLYALYKQAFDKMMMGFDLSSWDKKLIRFGETFDERILSLNIDMSLDDALDCLWDILSNTFEPQQVGVKQYLINKFRPMWHDNANQAD